MNPRLLRKKGVYSVIIGMEKPALEFFKSEEDKIIYKLLYKGEKMKKRWILCSIFLFLFSIIKAPSLSQAAVYRISGEDRYETANLLAEQFQWTDNAVVVSGSSYADALAAGPYAANIGGTIFLAQENRDLTEVLEKYKVKNVIIIGGDKAVPQSIEDRFKENFEVFRIAGKDRYETSKLVNEQTESSPITVGLATGRDFPDALSAGVFLARQGHGLHLVDGQRDYTLPEGFEGVYTFGGTASMIRSRGTRIEGRNRYETAANIAAASGDYNAVVVASGENFPDALAVTPFAANIKAPIVLTGKDSLSPEGKAAIEKAENVYIIGGTNAVSQRVEDEILGKTPAEPDPPAEPKPPVPVKPIPETKNGITTIDGIIIANKKYSLPSSYNPGLSQNVKDYFNRMQRDGAAQGHRISIGSGFRSYSYQKSLYESYVRRYGRAYADRISAKPGHSEHQTGLAIDIKGTSYYLNQNFASTKAGIWLAENAHRYGFILRYPKGKEKVTGYIFEPWHFRYVGTNLAPKIYKSGKTVEEYYGM